jgi:hypothetical protein
MGWGSRIRKKPILVHRSRGQKDPGSATLKAYNNKYDRVLSVYALIFLKNFCFLVDEKFKLKVLACTSEIPYWFLRILTLTCFKDPKTVILTLKNANRKLPVIL